LALPELYNGHSGKEVAEAIVKVLEFYGIKDNLGYLTADNATANDTLCRELGELIEGWDPLQRRLRCLGHIINLAVQSFLFAKNNSAVNAAMEYVSELRSIESRLIEQSQAEDEGGWIKQPSLQKVLKFVVTLRRSTRLFNAFKKVAGKSLRQPNETRWNSYLNTFEDALQLRPVYTSFIIERPTLHEYELTAADWSLIETTIAFLKPFKEATKRCEGDYITLDKVQEHMDALREHFEDNDKSTRSQPALHQAVATGWYAFDQYYSVIDNTGAYSAALLLHPNHRKSYIDNAWPRDWRKAGVERARALWVNRYRQDEPPEAIDTSTLTHFEQYRAKIAAKQRSGGNGKNSDEFERFIHAPPDALPTDTSPLDWWLQSLQQRSYPQLSKMATDVLSCQAMSAEDERVFSGARRTVPWTRARLSSRVIEQLECIKHWQTSGVVTSQFEDDGLSLDPDEGMISDVSLDMDM
jgi:hypothetical protein